jgi:hypothetical protein
MQDVKIYGAWDSETIGDDPRFKGSKKFDELRKELSGVKYTLIIPIKKGWVTSKWVEMISNGIIPFFHPTYDEQKHCKVPEYIRLKSPKELREKIQELELNPELYTRILNECISCIKQEDIDGTGLSTTILDAVPPINKSGTRFSTNVLTQQTGEIDEW